MRVSENDMRDSEFLMDCELGDIYFVFDFGLRIYVESCNTSDPYTVYKVYST